jgi:DNA mismatch repair protein MutS2
MKQSSSELLEFDALLALLGRFVSSELGRRELALVAPSTNRAALEAIHRETAEAIEYVQAASRPQTTARGAAARIRFESLPDAEQSARKLAIEGVSLEAKEILDLTALLERASEIRMLLSASSERFPLLGRQALRIGEFRDLLRELSGKILPDGTVADHASVALNRLRREMEKQQRAIQESLEKFIRAHRDDGLLQEEFVAIRNDRFVVPLVAGQRRKVDGVIHAASGSGHTLFVEPLETIHLNNELVRLTEEEMREVHRILREMTARLRSHAAQVGETLDVMGELELLFAKANFAVEFDCVTPRFGERLMLREARHPLLQDVLRRQRKRVVPVNLTLEGGERTLLISGPNTGGKTVSMKTVGLLALMAQSGLPVPCSEAEFPVFENVLADIGDNQSIEQSLSSFSAHVARVKWMLDEVTPDSLVLLDELGRATDPEEGGALGVAFLDYFRSAGAMTLASTHLLALKIYGANTKGVLNASMGFDDETLEPTYVLRTGAPGKSAGLDIASRLGLPPELIDRARSAMSSGERDIAAFLGELHRRIEEVSSLEEKLKSEIAELNIREAAAAKSSQKREAEKLKEIERRCDLLMEKFDAQARETLDAVARGTEHKKALQKVAKTRREFEHEVETTVLSTMDESRQGVLAKPRIVEGARVRLRDIREPARVRRVLSNGLIEVEAGFLKMQVAAEDVLEVLPDSGPGSALPKNVTLTAGPKWDVSYSEINVIGQRAEEAIANVDKFLDSAAMAEVDRVRVVHGHGMGVLKRAVAELLAHNPHVARFYAAAQSEGGAGATIAELR